MGGSRIIVTVAEGRKAGDRAAQAHRSISIQDKYVYGLIQTDNDVEFCETPSRRDAGRVWAVRPAIGALRHVCRRFALYRQICLYAKRPSAESDHRFSEQNREVVAWPRPTNLAPILLTLTQPWVTPKRAPTPFPSEVTHESG